MEQIELETKLSVLPVLEQTLRLLPRLTEAEKAQLRRELE